MRRAPARGRACDEAAVRAALAEVPDPELPMLSIVDLGIVHRVDVAPDGGPIRVEILPTFVGCPALELIKAVDRRAPRRLRPPGRGRRDLRGAVDLATGSAPAGPPRCSTPGSRPRPGVDAPDGGTLTLIGLEPRVPCPYCGSRRTVLDNAFGPTQCRTLRYCLDCRQPFEAIKPV